MGLATHRVKVGAWILAKRVAMMIGTLICSSLIIFFALNVLPGSPAEVILGTQSTPSAVRQLTATLGLNKPLWRLYVNWVGGLLHGDFGTSYISHLPISGLMSQAMTVTGPLVLMALVIGLLIGVPLGFAGALRNGRFSGSLIGSLSQIGMAVPTVVAGLVLILLLTVKVRVFPSSGFSGWSDPFQAIRSLILPAFALGLVEGAIFSRYVRASVLEQLRSDYMRTARSKGLRVGQALRRHGLRNAAIPLITVVALELSGLVIGAILVENVFELPGIGLLLLQSVDNRDLLTVQDITMLVAAFVLVVNMLVDLTYQFIDPRLKAMS
jgi:peptide/nickel transport system permease protein